MTEAVGASAGGLSSGAISAIVIALFLSLATVAIGAVVLLFLYYKRRPTAVSGITRSSGKYPLKSSAIVL